jgi:hypothetical protein
MLFSSEEFELVRLGWGAATGCFNRIHQAAGLAYGEKLDRKQVDTLEFSMPTRVRHWYQQWLNV